VKDLFIFGVNFFSECVRTDFGTRLPGAAFGGLGFMPTIGENPLIDIESIIVLDIQIIGNRRIQPS
jgi:hypothetical protein